MNETELTLKGVIITCITNLLGFIMANLLECSEVKQNEWGLGIVVYLTAVLNEDLAAFAGLIFSKLV